MEKNKIERFKSWQLLSFSLSATLFFIFIVFFIFQANLIYFYLKGGNDELEISNVQVLAVRATNYPVPRLAIYKNNRKKFYSDCLWEFKLCDRDNFYKKTDIKKIVAVKQTNSYIVIKEIHFLDGSIGYNLNAQDANILLYHDFKQSVKSVLIFLFSSIFFFMLGMFLLKFRSKLCQDHKV